MFVPRLYQQSERLHQEKQTAVTRAEKKLASQIDELSKAGRLKDEELKSTRALLREQEEATRALGEKMRMQARVQVKLYMPHLTTLPYLILCAILRFLGLIKLLVPY